MAAMDMDEDEDIWANTSSPSESPPQPAGVAAAGPDCGFISTQLSLNSHLHLLSSAAGAAPDHFAADGGAIRHHVGLGAGFRNAAASSPAAPFFSSSYGLDAVPAPPLIDAGPAHNALEREMCLGPAAGPTWAGPVGGTDRRKKRMIKNRESAARSRARKQAYIRELEKEVKHLQQENQSLRDKYEQVHTRSKQDKSPCSPSGLVQMILKLKLAPFSID
ncbi:hypothetical protein PR202_gb23165 [Eleusine coracana subsp. coracana]|uniref:BZIP domain-containing protein n=1 Tax=Eleusine coracana subsp. coracana TaxID=191504 RepID=A0AAV5FJS7_ELECO|nr:hypothetical protein PR202_gb23165 [Eleusine coracana subsp. coracana]